MGFNFKLSIHLHQPVFYLDTIKQSKAIMALFLYKYRSISCIIRIPLIRNRTCDLLQQLTRPCSHRAINNKINNNETAKTNVCSEKSYKYVTRTDPGVPNVSTINVSTLYLCSFYAQTYKLTCKIKLNENKP